MDIDSRLGNEINVLKGIRRLEPKSPESLTRVVLTSAGKNMLKRFKNNVKVDKKEYDRLINLRKEIMRFWGRKIPRELEALLAKLTSYPRKKEYLYEKTNEDIKTDYLNLVNYFMGYLVKLLK